MIHVSRTPEFSNCGNMNSVCTSSDHDMGSMAGGRSRQRSHSYYSPEDCKNYGVQTQTEETNLRPRSRYVFTINLKTCACFFFLSKLCHQTTRMFINVHVDLCFCCDKIGSQTDHAKHKEGTKKEAYALINTELTGHSTVLRHQSFTLAMTWVHWDRRPAPCTNIK